jgi:hypothetical protein
VTGGCRRNPIRIEHLKDLPTVAMAPDFTHRGAAVGFAQHDATLGGIWTPLIT